MTKPTKPTGNETLEVRPNTIPHFATGTDGLINFYGTGYEAGDYEIRYLDFVWTKRVDESGKFYFGISASAIPEDKIGQIEATVNVRGENPHKVLASCTFEVIA